MARFLATNGVRYLTEGILMSAKESLTLVMNHLKLSDAFLEHIVEVNDKKVDIKIVFRENELTTLQQEALSYLSQVSFYHLETVKTNCCFNEDLLLLSSMNPTEFHEKESKHMGMLIERKQDEVLYKEVIQETYALLSEATKVSFTQEVATPV